MSFLKVQFSHQRLTMRGDIYSKICFPYFSSPITPEKKDSLLLSPGSTGSNNKIFYGGACYSMCAHITNICFL